MRHIIIGPMYFLLLINSNGVWCSPPAPPVKCDTDGCTVSNAYGIFPDRSTCRAAAAVFPSSEEELVATGSRNKQKMRVVTRWSHSIPKLVCPGGEKGLIISTQELKRVVGVDEELMRISVESGAALGEITDALLEGTHHRRAPLYRCSWQLPLWDGKCSSRLCCGHEIGGSPHRGECGCCDPQFLSRRSGCCQGLSRSSRSHLSGILEAV